MDDISVALDPPRFAKRRGRAPIRLARSPSPVWPLAALNGREPVVLPCDEKARGIELAYARATADDARSTCPPGSPNGTETHLMPHMTAALAIDDGVITYAGRYANGFAIIINHDNGWGSQYANLETLAAIRTDLYRRREQYVRAGDVIGTVGAPAPGAFKRLYFELRKRDASHYFVPVDPRPRLAEWKLLQHYYHFTPAPSAAEKEVA